jgi:hypothetical protein
MRPTVDIAISDRAVKTDDAKTLERVVNKELVPFASRARKGLNARGIDRTDPVTSDGAGTYAIAWTSDTFPQDAHWGLEAHIEGYSATVWARYVLVAGYKSTSGTIAATFPQAFEQIYESAAACDARYTIDATNRVITLDVRDDAVAALQWTVVVYTSEGLPVQT